MDNTNNSYQTILRKIGEDPYLRPFLSNLFDPQVYIKNIIRDGKSEDCYNTIITAIELINEEIKRYIAKNKDHLMNGMQDITSVADQYSHLSQSSKILQMNIQRLKNEITESYSIIKHRTNELERINSTCQIMNQVKLFVTFKNQLDQYLKNPGQQDASSLATAAKTISELEKIIANPALTQITIINNAIPTIKQTSTSIRILAQTQLFTAVIEKQQVAISNYLQVFYNLDMLIEVIIGVIDHIVKYTVEQSIQVLSFQDIYTLYHSLLANGAVNTTSSTTSSTMNTTSNKKSSTSTASSTSTGNNTPNTNNAITIAQFRIAIRDLAQGWCQVIYDAAIQVNILQKVIQKKEDYHSHRTFLDILQQYQTTTNTTNTSTTSMNSSANNLILQYILKNQLVDGYLYRLQQRLPDIFVEKLKQCGSSTIVNSTSTSTATTTITTAMIAYRCYPALHKALVDILEHIHTRYHTVEFHEEHILSSQFLTAIQHSTANASVNTTSNVDISGQFASLVWSPMDLLKTTSILLSSPLSTTVSSTITRTTRALTSTTTTTTTSNVSGDSNGIFDGLKPLKDRYVAHVFEKMNAPILQMFPDLDGYIAAIPSKRDLQTLIKAIQQEYYLLAIEGDSSLLPLLDKEFFKIVQLLLTKVENMIVNTADSRKIQYQQQFQRTHIQEHNGQCYILLLQVMEGFELIPSMIHKQLDIDNNTNTTTTNATATANTNATTNIIQHIQQSMSHAISLVEDIAYSILVEIIHIIHSYCTTILLSIHREGIVSTPTTIPTIYTSTTGTSSEEKNIYTTNTNTNTQECSAAVQTLTKQLPNIMKQHILVLPKSRLLDDAKVEFAVKLIGSYISIVALVRPVNEYTRLRTAQDITHLEVMLNSLANNWSVIAGGVGCPVIREYKAFRRLIFEDEAITTTNNSKGMKVPKISQLLALEYSQDLRPSTLLNYLISCAPTQLPSPCDTNTTATTDNHRSLSTYIDTLLDVSQAYQQVLQGASSTVKARRDGVSITLLALRQLYLPANNNVTTREWKQLAGERKSWQAVQQCLDVFFQRIAVAEGEQKVLMRQWYEAIMDLGSQYFK